MPSWAVTLLPLSCDSGRSTVRLRHRRVPSLRAAGDVPRSIGNGGNLIRRTRHVAPGIPTGLAKEPEGGRGRATRSRPPDACNARWADWRSSRAGFVGTNSWDEFGETEGLDGGLALMAADGRFWHLDQLLGGHRARPAAATCAECRSIPACAQPWTRYPSAGLSVGQFVGQIRGIQGNSKDRKCSKSTTYVPPQTPAAPYRMGSNPIGHPNFPGCPW